MSFLGLADNDIECFQFVVDRIKSDKTRFVSNSLRILNLEGNPITGGDDYTYIHADIFVARKFQGRGSTFEFSRNLQHHTVYDLGDISGRFNSKDVKYALRINHAGRSIVESRGNMKPLLLSMWPNLLEKAFESRKAKGPTGLHCLLRNGPALANRIGFCGGDGNAKEKNPNKRMITDVKKSSCSPRRSCVEVVMS